MQTLLTCVFHLKSLVIVTPRYLMFSTFSRSVPSKVYEAWIFLIRFLVSCIILHLTGWNLIPHFLKPVYQQMALSPLVRRYRNDHSMAYQVPIANTGIYKCSFFPQTIRDWNELPDSLISSAEGTEDGVAKFTSLLVPWSWWMVVVLTCHQ